MSTPLRLVSGKAYPLGLENVDTDTIIPSRFLKKATRTGMGEGAFEILRSGKNSVFDDERYASAPILIAGENFGCGSSREHALWALLDIGITVVIAPSFSDIFSSNAYKNGILTIVLPKPDVTLLLDIATSQSLAIDLEAQIVTTEDGQQFSFKIDAFRKHCLLEGLDEIALTLTQSEQISIHERHRSNQSWMDRRIPENR